MRIFRQPNQTGFIESQRLPYIVLLTEAEIAYIHGITTETALEFHYLDGS